MGTISDLVNFQMTQPVAGSNLKPLPGFHVGGGVGATDDTSDPNAQLSAGGKGIGQAIGKAQAPSAQAQQQANWGTPAGDVDGAAGAEDFLPDAGAAAGIGADAGALAAASDQNLKTNVSSAERPLDDFLQHLGAHQYEYKDKQDGAKTYVSPMAQELEKTTIGKSAVIDTPRGKMVDYARIMGATLSAVAIHHQDIKDVQKTLEYLKKAVEKRKS
jgi:hypothetical protein